MPRFPRILGIPALAVLVAACKGGFVPIPIPNPIPPRPITAGTLNIRFDNPADGPNAWANRRALVAEIVRTGDFWGLQEALPSQVRDLQRDCPEMTFIWRTRESDPTAGESCPIVYRTALWAADPQEQGTFWLSETPDVAGTRSWDAALPRICTWARFVAPRTTRALYVFNVHLDHRGPRARLESARLLAARIAARRHPDPVIVLGDFNSGPASDPVRALLADPAIDLVDAWRAANPALPEQPTFNGWRERPDGDRIDFVLPSRSLPLSAARIDLRRPAGRWPSDHSPVHATFEGTVPFASPPDPGAISPDRGNFPAAQPPSAGPAVTSAGPSAPP